MNTQEKMIYNLFNTLWKDHEISVIEQYFSEDVLIESPLGVAIGIAGKLAIAKHWLEAFPKFNGGVDRIISHGGQVLLRWSTVARQDGEFCGVPATGKYFSYAGNSSFCIRNNKIVEYKAVTTVGDAFAEIGLQLKLLPKQSNYAAMVNAVRYVRNTRLHNKEVEILALKIAGMAEIDIAKLLQRSYLDIRNKLCEIFMKLNITSKDLLEVILQEGTINIFIKIANVVKQNLWQIESTTASKPLTEAC